MEEQSSCSSPDSNIYISSSSDEGQSDGWDSNWSLETVDNIKRIEQEVTSSPMLIGGRIMTTGSLEEQITASPSSAQTNLATTPKLGLKYFDEKLCYAPTKETSKTKIDLCRTKMPVTDSPMSPPPHERGPSEDTPLLQPVEADYHASYHIQSLQPYADLSKQQGLNCMICGRSIDAIKEQKTNWYIEQSTPRNEPAHITRLRREAYQNALNAGSVFFLNPAVSQAAACDGTRITTTSIGQEVVPGTLPIY